MTVISNGPHQGQPTHLAGVPIHNAKAAVVMMHGRGATAKDILMLVPELENPDFAYLAPQAAGNAWYPNSAFAPLDQNEPHLSSALAAITGALATLTEAAIPAERTILLGFSQGACLALEYAARNARRYGGLVGLSGGLIGSKDDSRNYDGSLNGTPVFLGCSDHDQWIPSENVKSSSETLRQLGGDVIMRLYPDIEHTTNADEMEFVHGIMVRLLA